MWFNHKLKLVIILSRMLVSGNSMAQGIITEPYYASATTRDLLNWDAQHDLTLEDLKWKETNRKTSQVNMV